jgi:hypothetical protein
MAAKPMKPAPKFPPKAMAPKGPAAKPMAKPGAKPMPFAKGGAVKKAGRGC